MAVLEQHAAGHLRQDALLADHERFGARQARAGGVDQTADDQKQECRTRGQLRDPVLEHGLRLGTTTHAYPTHPATTRRPPWKISELVVESSHVTDTWEETTSIGTLRSDDLAKAGVVFRYNHFLYRTKGEHLSNGGMGTVYELERRDDETH